ncbi:MAG: alpha-glucoside ABC transporter permease, partial [Pseudomonadota bacterium]
MAVSSEPFEASRTAHVPSGLKVGLIALVVATLGIILSVVGVIIVRAFLNLFLPLDIALVNAMVTMILGVVACVGYFFGSNFLLERVYPDTGDQAGLNIATATAIRPWLFLGPALVTLGLYLVYPVFNSVWVSLYNTDDQFVGFANYAWMFGDAKFQESLFNNLMWLIIVPAGATAFGLIAAALTDRIWWGNIAKSLIFMPMAISF